MNPLVILVCCFIFLVGYVLNSISFGAGNDVYIFIPALTMLLGLGGVIWGLMLKA